MDVSASAAVPLALVAGGLVFWAWCLRDLVRTDERDVRTFSKPVWLVLVTLGSVLGAALWWFAGRPRT